MLTTATGIPAKDKAGAPPSKNRRTQRPVTTRVFLRTGYWVWDGSAPPAGRHPKGMSHCAVSEGWLGPLFVDGF